MTITPTAGEVRNIVNRIFASLGVSQQSIGDITEKVMIDEGRILARSYRVGDLMAMWLVDVGIIQFYDEEGNMIQRTNLLADIEPRKMAA